MLLLPSDMIDLLPAAQKREVEVILCGPEVISAVVRVFTSILG